MDDGLGGEILGQAYLLERTEGVLAEDVDGDEAREGGVFRTAAIGEELGDGDVEEAGDALQVIGGPDWNGSRGE